MALNVAQIIIERARRHPASPAIITQDLIITYGRLGVAVGVVARQLRHAGVMPGQIVGLSMGQNALHLVTLLAMAQVGAVSLPLHPAVPVARRALAARRFGAASIVSGRDDMALPGLPFLSLANLSFDGSSIPPDADIHPVEDDAPFRIAISSGTSGDPKGMVLTHHLMTLRAQKADHGVTETSRTLPMDLNFIVGFRPAMSALARGGVLVMPPSFGPDDLLHALASHAVTHVYLSPAQARGLVEPLASAGIRCPNLVCLRIGGGPLAGEILRELRQKISPNVYVSYGSTESGLVSYATPEILERHPSCVGRVSPWAEIEVVREDHPEQKLPPGNIGLLRIRSDHQVSGYYLDDERSNKHFRDGWFYPGDLGGFDEDGLLYIEGRSDDQLNIGGLKINPVEIEATLMAHREVLEAGAFACNPSEGSEVLAVAVVLRDGAKIEEIQRHAATTLGPLAPARYYVVPSMPRTLTGKLRRGELTAQFSKSESSQ